MFCCCYFRHCCLLCFVAVTLDTHVCSLLIQLSFKLCLTAFPSVDAKRLLKPVYPAVCRGIQVVLHFLVAIVGFWLVVKSLFSCFLPFVSFNHVSRCDFTDSLLLLLLLYCLLCPVTDLLSPLPHLFYQQLSPPFTLQVSVCSTSRIMCYVPSTALLCIESTECFREFYLYFDRLLLFLSLVKQPLFQHVN